MKSVSINLDDDRSAKLQALSDSTSGHTAQVQVAGQNFEVEQRKISASAIAIGLLNAAIDNAYAQLPQ
jgi:predicted transcriptional regulator